MKKILILSANPNDTTKLHLDQEVRSIQDALERAKNREQFQLITELAVRVDDLHRALLDYQPSIVHFCGHGSGSTGLVLENASGDMQLVSTEALARLFKLFQQKIECVLLNACYSEAQAEAIFQHINYVIGMKTEIGDVAAIKFARGFYDALGAGSSYEDSYATGCAVIDLEGIPESSTPVLKARPFFPIKSNEVEPQKPLLVETESSKRQNQVNNLSGISAGGNFNYAPVQAGGSVNLSSSFNQGKHENTNLNLIFSLLAQLKQDVNQSKLNPLLKSGANEQVEKLEQELKKPELNHELVKQTINILIQGFEGIVELANLTAKIDYLVTQI